MVARSVGRSVQYWHLAFMITIPSDWRSLNAYSNSACRAPSIRVIMLLCIDGDGLLSLARMCIRYFSVRSIVIQLWLEYQK